MKRFSFFLQEEEILQEGINDPNLFKAIFMAGGPGSGKSFVSTKATDVTQGLKVINSDTALEFLLKKAGMSKKMIGMTPEELEKFAAKRTRAKEMTAKIKKLYLNGKLGVIIDSTAHDYKRIAKEKKEMEDAGYDTFMIFVNTSLDVAQANNLRRDRKLDPKIVEDSWKDVQKNIGRLTNLFRGSFEIVDNDKDEKDPEMVNLFRRLTRYVKAYLKRPLKSKLAKKWIAERQKLVQKGKS
jgi:dephospho-CoA kinase|tara:strand:+ start:1480 stop:2199 length:720 start_codon:yes stop_codon:yes gene_type:complete